MTELEKIAYAKSFIDKLANGINPLDDTPIPDDDIANNVRLSRCFFYVSDILRQVYENGGVNKPKRTPKIPFAVSVEQLEKFEYSEEPIPVSEIAKRIYEFEEVSSVYLMSGAFDLTVIVEGRTMKEVALFVRQRLAVLDPVTSTATHFVLKKYKENGIFMESEKKDEKRKI